MAAKFALFADQHIDGHCPLLRGKELNSYIVVGIRTEREATIAEKGLEKLCKGMRVLICEDSVSHDLNALQPIFIAKRR